MNFKTLAAFLGLIIAAAISNVAYGQIALTGMVADSATMEPLPNVNIVSKKTGRGTISDIRGSFSMRASQGDSIIFSRVGYRSKILPVSEVRELVVVVLKEEQRMLETVEILDATGPSWLPKLPPENPWQNRASDRRFSETPGFQGVQTFGPGYVFKDVFSRMSKSEKEKRKLVEVMEDNYGVSDYVNLVNSPEVKGKVMDDYDLTEDEYYNLLAKFNEEYQDNILSLESHEVIALLLKFLADQHEKD